MNTDNKFDPQAEYDLAESYARFYGTGFIKIIFSEDGYTIKAIHPDDLFLDVSGISEELFYEASKKRGW